MISGGSPFSRLDTVPVTGSTQDDLRAALTGPERASWPHLSALRALAQTAGRGRSGRAWVTPDDGGALLVSVVLRPLVPVERLAWLPLLAGLAGLLLAIDGVGITESRIALLDVFIGFFATLFWGVDDRAVPGRGAPGDRDRAASDSPIADHAVPAADPVESGADPADSSRPSAGSDSAASAAAQPAGDVLVAAPLAGRIIPRTGSRIRCSPPGRWGWGSETYPWSPPSAPP
mgnify:CR=1 FL=1